MSWVAVAAAGVTAASTIYSTSQNSAAAKKAASASLQGSKIQSDAIDKQIAAIRSGIGEASAKYGDIAEQTHPALGYLKGVMTGSTALTPVQETAREDLMRRVTNSSQVAGSALRGSGRSFVDAMRAVEGDFTNKALEANRARADAAAQTLQAPYFNAQANDAAAHATMGQTVGNAIAHQGDVNAGGIVDAATTKANASLANAGLITSAAGTIAGQIATQNKGDILGRPSTQTPPFIPQQSKPEPDYWANYANSNPVATRSLHDEYGL